MAGKGLSASFFGPWGGCHKETTFQAQLMYFSKRWGWRNGICGFLDVTKGILGPMTPKAGFHE